MYAHRSARDHTERDPLLSQDNRYASGPPPYAPLLAPANTSEAQEHAYESDPPKTRTGRTFIYTLIVIFLVFILPLGASFLGYSLGTDNLEAERQGIARRDRELDDRENHLNQVNATLIEDNRLWNIRRSNEQTRLDRLSARLNDWERSLNQESENIRLERKHWNEEREKKEEEERQDKAKREKAGLHWIDLEPEEACLSYGKRKYRAQLSHLPSDAPGMTWCWTVPVTIHGVDYSTPDRCENLNGEIYGEWTVAQNEPSCQTYFDIQDHEETCVHGVTNRRRFVGKLENFHEKDWPNWSEMCETTPFSVHQWNFERAHRCELWPGAMGAVGIIEVYDGTCGLGSSESKVLEIA
ncbi:hypothetical protein DL96DRAFT_1821303 [Flagelloscypha sp. PMI_526]|nr:hypothetical protein DL96DRAFT_1821303 [Flagelloscypha sp. PMI_526]